MSVVSEESLSQHLAVLNTAAGIYIERSEVRGELWTEDQFTIEDFIEQIRFKSQRARAAASIDSPAAKEELLDSLYDAINYAAFAVRKITGETP